MRISHMTILRIIADMWLDKFILCEIRYDPSNSSHRRNIIIRMRNLWITTAFRIFALMNFQLWSRAPHFARNLELPPCLSRIELIHCYVELLNVRIAFIYLPRIAVEYIFVYYNKRFPYCHETWNTFYMRYCNFNFENYKN